MKATAILALINFVAFVSVSIYLGGDAVNGYIRDGHSFVCAHGSCTEVSRAVWTYSYWHALTALGAILLLFVEAAIFVALGDIDLDFGAKS